MSIDEIDWLEQDEGEKTIWKGKPHRNSLYPAYAVGILLLTVGVGIFLIAFAYLNRENTEYLVTNEGIYKKTGIIGRRVKKINFDKVQDTSYNQGYFGRMFEYGNVDISTAGGSQVEMRFRSVPEPRKVQEIIGKRIHGGKSSSDTNQVSEKELLNSILHELKELNRKIE